MMNGMEEMGSLDPDDKVRFYGLVMKALRFFESVFWQWQRGGLEQNLRDRYAAQLDDFLAAPGIRVAWWARRHHFHKEFAEFVDTAIARDEGRYLFLQVA